MECIQKLLSIQISSMSLPNYLIFFSLLFLCFIANSADSNCPKSFKCGKFSMEFPFSSSANPSCGVIIVDGCDTQPRILSGEESYGYPILEIMQPNTLRIRDPELQGQLSKSSCIYLRNVVLSRSPSILFTIISPNLTFFSCKNQSYDDYFRSYKSTKCGPRNYYYKTPPTDRAPTSNVPEGCRAIQLPIKNMQDWGDDLFHLLEPEFILEWSVSAECQECHGRGGQCLSNSSNQFQCEENKGVNGFRKIFLIGSVAMIALISTFAILILFIRRKYALLRLFKFQKAKTGNVKDIELFLKNNGNLAPMRYSYSDIKKMTNSFIENLGKGGYGSVYKGKLPDGRLVAVKILNESKGNGEEFMNEVASISRTSHVNIVTLLGFCFEGAKRALIYEFMSNGSLEKFIQNTSSASAEPTLGWQKMFEIALGIARGLEYLHQGCKMRILHFDIKPHNILLDEDLNPRISDFGLAKLCPNRSSIVSMLVARGTIGYIAPEVFCRNFGEVSHKSDVYSYGMMVLEIAGGKKNNDHMDMDRSSEIYFPHYIYKQLGTDADGEGNVDGIMGEDESQFVKRKLIIVGLWCIQTDPRDRPSMTKVVEMLEGSVESLQVPPKPYLSSPPRSPLSSFSPSASM